MPLFRSGKPRVGLTFSGFQIIPAFGTLVVAWDTADQEPDVWDVGTPTEYPAIKTGTWLLAWQVLLFFVDQTNVALVTLYRNADAVSYKSVSPTLTASIADGLARSARLLEDDVLTLTIDNGTPADLYLFGNGYTFLEACRIGPERWTG